MDVRPMAQVLAGTNAYQLIREAIRTACNEVGKSVVIKAFCQSDVRPKACRIGGGSGD